MGREDDKLHFRNSEGYPDPTVYTALKRIEEQERVEKDRFHKLLHTIFYICELAGFEVEGRIVLRDKRSGKVWR